MNDLDVQAGLVGLFACFVVGWALFARNDRHHLEAALYAQVSRADVPSVAGSAGPKHLQYSSTF